MLYRLLAASALSLGVAILSMSPGMAQSSMMSSSEKCTPEALHASMMAFEAKTNAMKMRGNFDQTYNDMVVALTKYTRDLSSWEMKCGKDSKTMKMAEKAHDMSGSLYTGFSSLTSGG